MKRITAFFPLFLCLAAGLGRWLDLVNCTDLLTGFPTAGSYLIRYILLAVLILIFFLLSFNVPQIPESLTEGGPVMGILLMVSGGMFAGLGGMCLRADLAATYLRMGLFNCLMDVLYLLTAVWLILAGISRMGKAAREPSGNVLLGIAGSVSFLLLTFREGLSEAANIQRISVVWSALGALAALWFGVRMIRACYLPDTEVGRGLYLSGCTCFLLNTCLILPQQVCFWLAGVPTVTFMALIKAVTFGVFGLVGLCFALTAVLSEEAD